MLTATTAESSPSKDLRAALLFALAILLLAVPPLAAEDVLADDIPVAKTPPGYWKTMPDPVLERCTEPLVHGAIDMRGVWKVAEVLQGRPTGLLLNSVQRIEQCGNRVVISAGGVTHDMRCDGTLENGVNDVAAPGSDERPIRVAASFEDGVHVLRPEGVSFTVERERSGDFLIWRYGPLLVLKLERVERGEP
ncbi:MAG: hypothetical protein AAGA81_12770 [Acidobacteriota bacterium]